MFTINKFNDIYNIAKSENEFTVDTKNLSIREKLRVIDFLVGLTFKSGKITKLNVDTFKIVL